MTMTKDALHEAIDRLADAGDESAIEKFILEHFSELPEDLQKELLFSFYADALEKEASNAPITLLQVEGLAAIEKLETIKDSLQKTNNV